MTPVPVPVPAPAPAPLRTRATRVRSRHAIPLAAASALLLATCSEPPVVPSYADGGDFVMHVPTPPGVRELRLHVPRDLLPGTLAPLIIAYHGAGIGAAIMQVHTGLELATDPAGIIVAYPESAVGIWDVLGLLSDGGVDDLAFTDSIIEHVARRIPIDRRRVLAVGLSNGGLFVQRLGCYMPDRFAGFVSVSATMFRSVAAECQPPPHISALFVLGSDDTQFPIHGTQTLLPVDSTLAFWATANGCAAARTREILPDTAHDGTIAHRMVHPGCTPPAHVWLDSIAGGGHGWPGAIAPLMFPAIGVTSRNLSANHAIVRFLNTIAPTHQ